MPLPQQTVLVCGDAVATSEHLEQGQVLASSWNREQALESFKEAIEIADVLVLVALAARDLKRDDLYVEMCRALARLLPLPADSQFRVALAAATRPVIGASLCAARAARIERGLPTFTLAHYRAAADD